MKYEGRLFKAMAKLMVATIRGRWEEWARFAIPRQDIITKTIVGQ